MDIVKVEPGVCRESFVTSSNDEIEGVGIKVEEETDVEMDQNPVAKFEHEVSLYVSIIKQFSQISRIT
jgi:hypothetical protein